MNLTLMAKPELYYLPEFPYPLIIREISKEIIFDLYLDTGILKLASIPEVKVFFDSS